MQVRLEQLRAASDRWERAEDLASSQEAAEAVRNLVTGPDVTGYRDRDGNGRAGAAPARSDCCPASRGGPGWSRPPDQPASSATWSGGPAPVPAPACLAARTVRDRYQREAHAFTRANAYAFGLATTVRVSEATRARAAALAASRGRSIGEVVDEALEALETAEFWRKTQEALMRHPVELDEDPVWELSVADGLDRE